MGAWAARGALAALLLGGLDACFAIAQTPEALGDFGLMAGMLLRAMGALLVPLTLLGLLVGLVARRIERPLPEGGLVIGALGGATLGALGLRWIDRAVRAQHLEFPAVFDRVVDGFAIGWLVVCVVVAFGLRRLKVPARPAWALALFGGVLLGLWVLHRGLAPIHDHRVMPLVGVGLMGLAVLAIAVVTPGLARRGSLVTAALAVLVGLGAVGPGDSAPTRYLSFARLGVARIPMRLTRVMFDGDGDGASPTWLGGADCDDGDPKRAPSRREVLGDGIDQDCAGGDAQVMKSPPNLPGPACMDALRGARPNILLVSLDAARFDAFGPETTPWMTPLIAQGLWFTRAYSPSSHTHETLPALHTGLMPSDLGAPDLFARGGVLPKPKTLAAALGERGYRTAAFATLGRAYIEYGFDYTGAGTLDPAPAGGMKAGYSASALNRQALDWLGAKDDPFFLWVHHLDAHAPYVPIDPGGFKVPGDAYTRAVAYVALQAALLIRKVQAAHPNTIIVLTSDHGEDLDRRGREGHGPDLYQGSVHVPLLVILPGCAAKQVHTPVSLVDLAPTLGHATGLLDPLWHLADAAEDRPRPMPVVSEVYMLGQMRRVVFAGEHALHVDVRNGGRLLFDVRNDRAELANLYGVEPLTGQMEAAYQRWLDRPPP